MTVARGTAAEIREALAIERTTDSAAAVKRAVARSLNAVDAGLTIETTEYFNHSFAPDLVLKWQRLPTRDERYVFLRFNNESDWIADELPRLASRHPLVYGLAATVEDEQAETLATRSKEADTLVTDPAGVDQLAAVPPAGIGSFVSRTLIRGGRGLVDEQRASRATAEISNGFEAARTADIVRTRAAADAAQEFLREVESSRLLRFLQAMWIGGGAAAEAFPAPVGPASDPGDEGLKFLIEHEEIDDRDFWRALGESLTIERLARLGISGSPRNLQHVVFANLDKLWARAFRVRPDQPRLDEMGQELLWRMEMGLLALSGSNFTAYLGTTVDEISGIKSEGTSAGVTVEELRARARAVAVDSLELSNGQRIVTYGSPDPHTDVAKDDELSALANALGSASVQRATITVGGRHLELDFTSATASARTSGRPPLADILGVALPLVWPLAPSDLQAFASMIASARDQQTLELLPSPSDD
jgi:hypothetical protein